MNLISTKSYVSWEKNKTVPMWKHAEIRYWKGLLNFAHAYLEVTTIFRKKLWNYVTHESDQVIIMIKFTDKKLFVHRKWKHWDQN